jgi:hypothetical protein
MDTLTSSLSVLSAMITPAVLISACGTLILSTSIRLGRVVDRVRDLSDRFERLAHEEPKEPFLKEKRAMIFDQLDRLTSRARLLQRSITCFYITLGIFIATTVSIGMAEISKGRYGWLPVSLGFIGACFLFYGSMLLIFEARLALVSVYKEMDFLWEMGKRYAPTELLKQRGSQRVQFKEPHE